MSDYDDKNREVVCFLQILKKIVVHTVTYVLIIEILILTLNLQIKTAPRIFILFTCIFVVH